MQISLTLKPEETIFLNEQSDQVLNCYISSSGFTHNCKGIKITQQQGTSIALNLAQKLLNCYTCVPDDAKCSARLLIERLTIFLPGFTVKKKTLVFQYSCDHQAVSTPQISLTGHTSATSATTGMVCIGLLSDITPPTPALKTFFFFLFFNLFRRCGDNLLCQIVIN